MPFRILYIINPLNYHIMDYRSFSAIYDALSSALADFETLPGASPDTIKKIKNAQEQVLKQFDHFFPCRVENVLNRPFFSTESFFGIIAKYPDLLKQKEEKFISFCCSLFIFVEDYPLEQNFQLTESFFQILNSVPASDYLSLSGNMDKVSFFLGYSLEQASCLGGEEAEKYFNTFDARWGEVENK